MKKRKIVMINLLFLFTLVSLGIETSDQNTVTHKQMGIAKIDTLFFDDFSGPELDRSRWNVQITGRVVNNEQQAYVDSGTTIYFIQGAQAEGAVNGALALHPRLSKSFVTKDGKTFDFISGRINTRGKFEFTNGTAAARIKLPPGSGVWPAFWALGNGRWPDSGEIDIMEYVGESDWTSVALHGPGYSGETPLVNKVYFSPENDATAWHVYSVDWSPEGFLFRVDGKGEGADFGLFARILVRC